MTFLDFKLIGPVALIVSPTHNLVNYKMAPGKSRGPQRVGDRLELSDPYRSKLRREARETHVVELSLFRTVL